MIWVNLFPTYFLNVLRVNLKRLACGIIDLWIKNMKKSLRIWE